MKTLYSGRWPTILVVAGLTIIVSLAGALRLYALTHLSLWIDEAVTVTLSKGVLLHGLPRVPDGSCVWDAFPASYITAAFLAWFPDVHLGARLPSALAGIFLLPVFYFLSQEIFRSRLQAMCSVLFLGFQVFEIEWSRQARVYVLLQLALVGAALCLLRFSRNRRPGMLISGIALTCLAPMFHRAGYLALAMTGMFVAFEIRSLVGWRDMLSAHKRLVILSCIVGAAGFGIVVGMRSNSSLLALAGQLSESAGTNYVLSYVRFLWQELGLFLPLSAAGILAGMLSRPRAVFPLAISAVAFFSLIALKTPLFAYRYVLPIFPFIILFGVGGCWSPWLLFRERWPRLRPAFTLVSMLIFAVSLFFSDVAFRFRERYVIDPTAPQPRWREAYATIRARENHIARSARPTLLSAFPFMDAIYMEGVSYEAGYLPVSHTGRPNEMLESPPYCPARIFHSTAEFHDRRGYVIVDDMALRMLASSEIKDCLLQHRPSVIIDGPSRIYIWLIDALAAEVPLPGH